jgi:hypothetical protein
LLRRKAAMPQDVFFNRFIVPIVDPVVNSKDFAGVLWQYKL